MQNSPPEQPGNGLGHATNPNEPSSASPEIEMQQMPIEAQPQHLMTEGSKVEAEGAKDIQNEDTFNVPSNQEFNPSHPNAPPLTRENTRPAIGPATDQPSAAMKEIDQDGPTLLITLLLTTGARHPFKLDRRYLRKRNVEAEDDNPANISLYKFKELILRDWREEWEPRPSSPDSIRLISMGKLLTDKSKLSEFGFKPGTTPTIMHMSVKPQEIMDEEEANKSTRDRDGPEGSTGCRCVIM